MSAMIDDGFTAARAASLSGASRVLPPLPLTVTKAGSRATAVRGRDSSSETRRPEA